MVVQGHGLWLLVCVLFFPLQSTDVAQNEEIRQHVPVTQRKSHVIGFWISIQHFSSALVLSTHGVYVATVRNISGIMRLFE